MIRPHARTRFWIFLSIFAICLYIFGFSEVSVKNTSRRLLKQITEKLQSQDYF